MPCDDHNVKGTIQLSKTCSAVINSCTLTHEHLQSIWQSSVECHVLTCEGNIQLLCVCVRACVHVCMCVCVCHTYIQYIPVILVWVALQSGEVLHGDGKEHITFIHSQPYSRENSIVHFIYCRDRFSCVYMNTLYIRIYSAAYIYIYIYIYIYTHHNLILSVHYDVIWIFIEHYVCHTFKRYVC